MTCKICMRWDGDYEDHLIRFICSHHPNCPNFKIDKTDFLLQFKQQVNIEVSKLYIPSTLSSETIPKTSDSKVITKKLYQYLSKRYFPISSNSYIFNWESDLLAVNKETNYITEYEIKISRNDFKADFKKFDKHQLIKDIYTYKFSSDVPNYFYYATTPGLLNKNEIPSYAGLIECGIAVKIIKRAPLLHKIIIHEKMVDNLLRKVYYKYWSNII